MDRAEEAALKIYPQKIEGDSRGSYDLNLSKRIIYQQGYHQAEKDLELIWNNVNDRLPKEEFDDGYTFVFVAIKLDEETYRFDVDYIRNGKWELHPDKIITHWMPIPFLPNTED